MSARLCPEPRSQLVPWSPDSKSVAFRVEKKIIPPDLASGAPVLICDMPPGLTWGADCADGPPRPFRSRRLAILQVPPPEERQKCFPPRT
jgi:hypothetical protein